MRCRIVQTLLECVEGDITAQEVDAIVNAANESLLGGGGVDGAIHRAAGPELLEETRRLGGCRTGDAKLTRGYRLPARYVIHAVGPVYRPDDPDVPRLLASAYRRCLEIAQQQAFASIAFPAISTGVYGYPQAEACEIALHTTLEFLDQSTSLRLIRFVLFGAPAYSVYVQTIQRMAQTDSRLHVLD
ncbi:MAG: O-acetyl-ADP-ribose deacetylase [Anaerolineae bacterium]|nr:O-acetyl-ADP-ribose deacetylase [Anaerolineae bacterium]MDW8171313.1 O-acetyl-ADP-ribose deacetylase [Anaerolineae bacterium]